MNPIKCTWVPPLPPLSEPNFPVFDNQTEGTEGDQPVALPHFSTCLWTPKQVQEIYFNLFLDRSDAQTIHICAPPSTFPSLYTYYLFDRYKISLHLLHWAEIFSCRRSGENWRQRSIKVKMATNALDEIKDGKIQTSQSPEPSSYSQELTAKKQSLSDNFTIVSTPRPFLSARDVTSAFFWSMLTLDRSRLVQPSFQMDTSTISWQWRTSS